MIKVWNKYSIFVDMKKGYINFAMYYFGFLPKNDKI